MLLAKAARNIDVGVGGVIAGTPQEREFDHAFGRGSEAAGNAVNAMSRAVATAEEIEGSLPG